MKKTNMTARKLRALLMSLIVMTIAGAGIGFYFAHDVLQAYAKTVSQSVANSSASGGGIQSLENLQEELASKQNVIVKSNSLIAMTQDYQNQSIKDIDTYAAAIGIGISNYGFAAAAAAPTPGAAASAPASGSIVTVTLTNPINYSKLLTFIKAIEGNLPKMQISSINLTRIEGDSTSIRADQLVVQVYTR